MTKDFIEPIELCHHSLISNFCTSDTDYDDYFKNYLLFNGYLDGKQGFGKTLLYIRETDEQKQILGFYTIRSSSLIIDNSDNNEKFGEPAVEILELAVHKDYQRQGIGTLMMKDIFNTANILRNNYLGVRYVLVCAKESAVPFYKKFKFEELSCGNQIPRNHDNQNCVGMSVILSVES